jgi:Zn-dependent protease
MMMRVSFAIVRGVPVARDVFGEMREAAGLVANHLCGPRQGVAVAIVRSAVPASFVRLAARAIST